MTASATFENYTTLTDVTKRPRPTDICSGNADRRRSTLMAPTELSPIFGDGLKDQAAAVWV